MPSSNPESQTTNPGFRPFFQAPKSNGFANGNTENQLNGSSKFSNLKEQIKAENTQIIKNQEALSASNLKAEIPKILTEAVGKKMANNQNYTLVPANSQISGDTAPWDGNVPQSPDEDEREELNLAEINQSVVTGLAQKHQELLDDIEKCQPSVLLKMASKMR